MRKIFLIIIIFIVVLTACSKKEKSPKESIYKKVIDETKHIQQVNEEKNIFETETLNN